MDAHVTTAHTTINPHVRRFRNDDATDHGVWLFEPGTPAFRKWHARLKADRDFRLSFPLMPEPQIHAAVAAG